MARTHPVLVQMERKMPPGISPVEADLSDLWASFHTEWKNLPWTSLEDAAAMASFYDANPAKLGNLTGEDLVGNIEWRIYTEWCCNRAESQFEGHKRYLGEGFSSWIEKETHLELERRGFKWDLQQDRFVSDCDFSETYKTTRDEVLRAAVKRSIDFFSACRNYMMVPEGNPQNLRVSLESYLR